MGDEEQYEHEDVITPVMQTAISSHEMFSALKNAGFTRWEALQIIIGMLTAGSRWGGDE